MTVVDGRDLDAKLARRLGPRAASLLGVSSRLPFASAGRAPHWVRTLRHQVLALLSSLKIVDLARAAGRPNVLVLEGDVRPVPRAALTTDDVVDLCSFVRAGEWEVIRPSGYFFDFARYRGGGRARGCPRQCRCARTTVQRGCLVLSSRQMQTRCDVRDTVGFAAHARTFPVFRRMLRDVLRTVSEMASSDRAAHERETYPVNASFGWARPIFDARVPWFDKWLPARFDCLYILPSIAVQQTRQGDEETSASFRRHCA
jgi:hypothetical protein